MRTPRRVPPPNEAGCLQALVVSRMIAQILFVPMLLIFGGILTLLIAIYAFATSALLGVAVIACAVVVLSVVAIWEYRRVKAQLPPPDDTERIDPRAR